MLIKILQFRKKPTHKKDVVLQYGVQLKAIHEKEPIIQMYHCRFSSEVYHSTVYIIVVKYLDSLRRNHKVKYNKGN